MAKEIPYKIYLEENEMPTQWYNVRADMKKKPAPVCHRSRSTGSPSEIWCKIRYHHRLCQWRFQPRRSDFSICRWDAPRRSKLRHHRSRARSVEQTEVFKAAEQFARVEGILPAPESSHAIKVAIDEAMKCKETGEAKNIVFGLTGTGYFDMVAYQRSRRHIHIAFFLSVQLQSIRISVLSSEIYLFRGKPDTTHVYHLESGRPRWNIPMHAHLLHLLCWFSRRLVLLVSNAIRRNYFQAPAYLLVYESVCSVHRAGLVHRIAPYFLLSQFVQQFRFWLHS